MNLSTHLKQHRKTENLSQETLAKLLNIPTETMASWENNESYPSLTHLNLLSNILHISVDQLIYEDIPLMKQQLAKQEPQKFHGKTTAFTALLLISVVLLMSSGGGTSNYEVSLAVMMLGVSLFYGFRVKMSKKQREVETYREIVAFYHSEFH